MIVTESLVVRVTCSVTIVGKSVICRGVAVLLVGMREIKIGDPAVSEVGFSVVVEDKPTRVMLRCRVMSMGGLQVNSGVIPRHGNLRSGKTLRISGQVHHNEGLDARLC